MNVVIDTNVLVSAAIRPNSVPAEVVAVVLARGTLLLSAETLAEVDEVLRRPRLDRFRPASEREELLTLALTRGRQVMIVETVAACRDPDDDKFLDVAVNGAATHLVTGDLDLLALHPFRGIPILTPADFLASVAPPTS